MAAKLQLLYDIPAKNDVFFQKQRSFLKREYDLKKGKQIGANEHKFNLKYDLKKWETNWR